MVTQQRIYDTIGALEREARNESHPTTDRLIMHAQLAALYWVLMGGIDQLNRLAPVTPRTDQTVDRLDIERQASREDVEELDRSFVRLVDQTYGVNTPGPVTPHTDRTGGTDGSGLGIANTCRDAQTREPG